MMCRLLSKAALIAACLAAAPIVAMAADSDSTASAVDSSAVDEQGRTWLVPSMRDAGYSLSKDKDRFKNRLSFSPAVGQLGSETVFSFRAGFSPNTYCELA